MKMNGLVKIIVSITALSLLASVNVSSAKNQEKSKLKVYKDAIGGSVLSNMPGEVWVSDKEAENQLQFLDNNPDLENSTSDSKTQKGDVSAQSDRYDIEENPILIGTGWNRNDCGQDAWTTYARHTIGDKTTTTNGDYLTSYGNATWYNSSGNIALPYRNGSSNTGQTTVDVKNGVYFSVRDLSTNKGVSVKRTDFGPNQCPGSRYTKVVVDLDTTTFKSLHGNTSDGLFYSRTWVPLTNWNP